MDLRYEFDQILLQYGYPVLLIRQEKKLRCSCWNEKRQESDRECPICFGLGWTPVAEKHTVRDLETSIPESYAFMKRGGSFGGMSVPGRQYYFRYNAQLSSGDLIVDVDWNGQKPVYTGRGIYEISHIDPARYERGEIIYQTAFVKDQPIEKQIRGIRIANVNGILNYEIAMEG
jgi:hypothetical protein